MKMIKKLLVMVSLILPISTWAACDLGYPNMFVYTTITNNSAEPLQCTYANINQWYQMNQGSLGNINTNVSFKATACYGDDGTNQVHGEFICNTPATYKSTSYSKFIGNLNFSHACDTALTHANGGSCTFSDYVNSANIGGAPSAPWSVVQTVGASGTNESSLSINFTYNG